jgi:hypothetical protein
MPQCAVFSFIGDGHCDRGVTVAASAVKLGARHFGELQRFPDFGNIIKDSKNDFFARKTGRDQ